MSHDEMESLVAGYVLLALDTEDREAFEAHLATCNLCAQSVAEWQQMAASLPLLVEQREPPQGLEGRILSAVRAQRAVGPMPASGAQGWRRFITRPVAVGATVAVLALAVIGLAIFTSGYQHHGPGGVAQIGTDGHALNHVEAGYDLAAANHADLAPQVTAEQCVVHKKQPIRQRHTN